MVSAASRRMKPSPYSSMGEDGTKVGGECFLYVINQWLGRNIDERNNDFSPDRMSTEIPLPSLTPNKPYVNSTESRTMYDFFFYIFYSSYVPLNMEQSSSSRVIEWKT
ncbi:hypothetical protein JTE90_008079 [Oedothorax gibbosus]|uniref:Uncharacterized protein n=1 Tax=Oedothorax gibbosus TaxID=931172 RepID=A0AAV6UXY5_9ARAC|nr:hypothetical protein JTE90_008079 [Oedothorax gibbosus]